MGGGGERGTPPFSLYIDSDPSTFIELRQKTYFDLWIVIFNEFEVDFTVSFFVGNPVK